MSFFDDLPEQPARPRQPQPVQPGWYGPPSDELPGVARVGGFFHKSQRMVVALKLVEVYSTGCLLELVWSVRRGNESDQEWREIVEESYNHPRSSLDTRTGLELGVAFADGRKAVAAIHGPLSFQEAEDVAGPVLTTLGGGGGATTTSMSSSPVVIGCGRCRWRRTRRWWCGGKHWGYLRARLACRGSSWLKRGDAW
ncbi:hypothetical protein ACIQTW_05695 [Paenarthrobacter sp. NPDC090517]|uniref:hypothetical protein n=1 Tax=Paenarthrobacter sp. NPDC090517 TaxID=3364381 RepID=UPI0038084B32